MTGQFVGEEIIVFRSSATNIMNDVRNTFRVFLVRNDHDMRSVSCDLASDKVTGFKFGWIFCHLQRDATALEVSAEVGDPPVIDILVGTSQAPDCGILGKILLHVLVNQLLKIEIEPAEGADDDIGANAALLRDVSIGIFDCDVSSVVRRGDTDLLAGCNDKSAAFGICCGFTAGEKSEKEEEGGEDSHFETSEVVCGVCLM